MSQQTLILRSEEILVVETDVETGVLITEVETILLVEDTEVVVLEVAEPGPPGADGGAVMTSGAGIVIVGTEIRLSIGTLPQME